MRGRGLRLSWGPPPRFLKSSSVVREGGTETRGTGGRQKRFERRGKKRLLQARRLGGGTIAVSQDHPCWGGRQRRRGADQGRKCVAYRCRRGKMPLAEERGGRPACLGLGRTERKQKEKERTSSLARLQKVPPTRPTPAVPWVCEKRKEGRERLARGQFRENASDHPIEG